MNPKPDPEFERVLKENLEYEKMSRSERAVWWAELPKRREREAQAADLAYQKKYPTCAQVMTYTGMFFGVVIFIAIGLLLAVGFLILASWITYLYWYQMRT